MTDETASPILSDEALRAATGFWRYYSFGVLGLAVFAVIFGQFFLALEFTENIGRAVLDRLLAISVVALFLERAIEVYVTSSRRLGELGILERIEEAREDAPDDRRLLRSLRRRLALYKLETQRIAFVVSLLFGVLIACTGLRVLDGLIVLSDEFRRDPVWQGRVWFAVDILLTGGVIGGGAAGIHELINTLSGRGFTKAGAPPDDRF
jgi:hypothetical protein